MLSTLHPTLAPRRARRRFRPAVREASAAWSCTPTDRLSRAPLPIRTAPFLLP